jgi:hypothetical protein
MQFFSSRQKQESFCCSNLTDNSYSFDYLLVLLKPPPPPTPSSDKIQNPFVFLTNFKDFLSEEDCSALRYICELVSRRAGFMASAGESVNYRQVAGIGTRPVAEVNSRQVARICTRLVAESTPGR